MKLKFLLIPFLVLALGLTACGGSGSDGDSASTVSSAASPAQFTVIDTVAGTGTAAAAGNVATVSYTGWLYSDTAADHKGSEFSTSKLTIVLGSGTVISGFEDGVTGMKLGGVRTVLVPTSMAYGATGNSLIPPNAGLVFELTMLGLQSAVASPAALSTTDTAVGTGTAAVTGKTVSGTYTGWLYSDTAADHKGNEIDAGSFTFVIGDEQMIPGFDQGVAGMLAGGSRTVLVPASLAYGTTGNARVPTNSGLVYDLKLTTVQ